MINITKLNRLRQTFAALLQDLSATWPKHDVEYVREEVGYGVYDDALENLIAIGLRSGMGFNPDQVRQVKELAMIMEWRIRRSSSSCRAPRRSLGEPNAC